MTLSKAQIQEYRRLKDSGVAVRKSNSIRFNAGGESETIKHLVGKTLAGMVALRNGYRVDSEVPVKTPNGEGEIDVLAWGNPDRLTYAIEVETSPGPGIRKEKQELYVDPTEVDDIQLINASNLPVNMLHAADKIATILGLEL